MFDEMQAAQMLFSLGNSGNTKVKIYKKCRFSDAQKEVEHRLDSRNTDRISRMVQLAFVRFGQQWVKKETLMALAREVGYVGKNTTLKGNMWYLKNSRFGRNKVATGDPFGKFFPYWTEMPNSRTRDMLRLSDEFFVNTREC